jgi:hypothetical protein
LIRRGFLGLRAAPPPTDAAQTSLAPPTVPGVKGATSLPNGAAALGRSLSHPIASSSAVSKFELGYFWRVKDKVAKQLSKNKEILAETLVVKPGEGVERCSKEVHSVMNVASVVGTTWGGDDNKLLDLLSTRERKAKGMRELKNLDCSMSPVKSQCRRGGGGGGGGGGGVLGLNLHIHSPLKFIRGVGLLGVYFVLLGLFFARVYGLGCFSGCFILGCTVGLPMYAPRRFALF